MLLSKLNTYTHAQLEFHKAYYVQRKMENLFHPQSMADSFGIS